MPSRKNIQVASLIAMTIQSMQTQGQEVAFSRRAPINTNAINELSDVMHIDIDLDGDLDLIAAAGERWDAPGPGWISWFENNGAQPPMFTENVLTTDVDGANSIAAGDVDGDGDVDFLVTGFVNVQSGTLAWLENDGQSPPSFMTRVITAGGVPLSVDMGDLDGDGDLDIVTGSDSRCQFAWFENDGAYPPGFSEHAIRPGNQQCTIAWHVEAVDMDDDGDLDAVATVQSPWQLAWYENDGAASPTFAEHVIAPDLVQVEHFRIVDLNDDQFLDVVVPGLSGIDWYRAERFSRDELVFTKETIDTPACDGISVADVDSDGDCDLIPAFRFPPSDMQWLENDGGNNPAFVARFIEGDGHLWDHFWLGSRNDAADLDGDGDLDVVTSALLDGAAVLLWFEQEIRFVRTPVVAEGNWEFSPIVPIADLDQDGDSDVLLTTPQHDGIRWLENVGSSAPTFIEHALEASFDEPSAIVPSDIDQDGDTDIVVAEYAGKAIGWLENDGESPPSFRYRLVATSNAPVTSIAIGDMDDDGDQDILAYQDEVVWYENRGQGQRVRFARHRIAELATHGDVRTYLVDMDGDLDLDVLTDGFTEAFGIAWFENLGPADPTFAAHEIALPTQTMAFGSVAPADINSDGRMDVVMTFSSLGFPDQATMTWHENNGANPPEFIAHELSRAAYNTGALLAVDVDWDGDVDIVAGTHSLDSDESPSLVWYENRASESGEFVYRRISALVNEYHSVGAGDLNGDGDIDLVSVDMNAVAWHQNRN